MKHRAASLRQQGYLSLSTCNVGQIQNSICAPDFISTTRPRCHVTVTLTLTSATWRTRPERPELGISVGSSIWLRLAINYGSTNINCTGYVLSRLAFLTFCQRLITATRRHFLPSRLLSSHDESIRLLPAADYTLENI